MSKKKRNCGVSRSASVNGTPTSYIVMMCLCNKSSVPAPKLNRYIAVANMRSRQ